MDLRVVSSFAIRMLKFLYEKFIICSFEKVEDCAKNMLGHYLITKQTGKDGRKVNKLFIAECLDFDSEAYFAIVLDRGFGGPVMIACKEGGVEIEEVAAKTPEKIIKEAIDIKKGPQDEQLERIATGLGFSGQTKEKAKQLFANLYTLFTKSDATQVEINPLVVLNDGGVACVDAKMNIDDNAEFRQPEIWSMRDKDEEDPREVEASKYGLNYIGLDGNIGCMGN